LAQKFKLKKMKKTLFSIFLAAAFLSCGSKSYTLEGTVQSAALNGITINIRTFDGENWTNANEVVVENQRFILKGVVKEPLMAMLSFNDAGKQLRGNKAFILENATIKFNIDEDMTITMSGSRDNDLLQSFDDDLAVIIPQEFIDSIQNNLITELELQWRIQEYSDKRTALITDFSTKNVNTLPGTFVFMNNSHALPVENRIAILDLMNENTKKNPRVQSIARQVEAEQRIATGNQYIDFTLPTPTGEMLSLSDFVENHDYVLIQFWASWCGPCIRSLPELKEFYAAHDRTKLEIFAVSLDNDKAAWENAINRHQIPWVQVSDLKGWGSEAGQLYAVSSIPCKILIDRNGTVVGRNLSISEMEELMK
jgi:peroxiredoxin